MLEIRDLHVKFRNRDREAVAGVSLTIHDGEILGLVGESGTGKSTLARTILGMVKPDAGQVEIGRASCRERV